MSISEHRSKQFSGQFDLNQIRRILILRMGPLGETLLTTPVIRALRRRFPEAHIAYMVAPGREDLVSENPNLDEVITYSVSIPKLIYNMAIT
ncbi:glycosyltransferase family 9 protein, partial [Candidatus Poribacteria bacterium]|nr:glycosyltransferase family 9 protein [Candidatus Poribacteria bacterium]